MWCITKLCILTKAERRVGSRTGKGSIRSGYVSKDPDSNKNHTGPEDRIQVEKSSSLSTVPEILILSLYNSVRKARIKGIC
jgi:hypothetical protein